MSPEVFHNILESAYQGCLLMIEKPKAENPDPSNPYQGRCGLVMVRYSSASMGRNVLLG